MSKTIIAGQDFCYCDDDISLQIVSGGGSDAGLYGEVTLKVGGEFVQYVRKDRIASLEADLDKQLQITKEIEDVCGKQVRELKAELAAAKVDGERYRWLRNHSWDEDDYGNREIYFRCDFENYDSLDEAIDRAREEKS